MMTIHKSHGIFLKFEILFYLDGYVLSVSNILLNVNPGNYFVHKLSMDPL